jgi:hypothetical protein
MLHRLTSYEPGRHWTAPAHDPRVLQDLQVNDPARLPWFFKRYPESLPRLLLPRELPGTTAAAIDVLAGTTRGAPEELDLPQLSRLLFLSAGVVRTMELPSGIPVHLRRRARLHIRSRRAARRASQGAQGYAAFIDPSKRLACDLTNAECGRFSRTRSPRACAGVRSSS